MGPVEFNTQLYFSAGAISVTLSRDFYHNCLTKDPFPHSHPMLELHYVIEGGCTVVTKTESLECGHGSFVLLPSHCTHRLLPAGDQVQTVSLMFSPDEDAAFAAFRTGQVRLLADTFGGELRLMKIREELAQCRPLYTEKIRGELTALLADIIRALGECAATAAQMDEYRAGRMEEYLMEHRFDPDCSCKALADRLHLSTRQVQRLCLQYYGATFRQLLTSMRMEIAAHRLHTTDTSVSELALQLGYASVASFSAAYKRYFGKSPSQERCLENRT